MDSKQIELEIQKHVNTKELDLECTLFPKGQVRVPKRMNFRKSSRGGGFVFNPEIYIANFGPL